jgi:hypothetical protein
MQEYPGMAVVMSHHFGKPPAPQFREDYDPLSPYNFRGASKWYDAPDTLVTFESLSPHTGEWKRMRAGFKMRQAVEPEPVTLAVLDGGPVTQVQQSFGSTNPLAKKVVKWGR